MPTAQGFGDRRAGRKPGSGIIGSVSELIVVTGPPGAGKSTVAGILARRFDLSALVAGDAFFAMVDRGYIDPWTGPAHRRSRTRHGFSDQDAARHMHGEFARAADSGLCVVRSTGPPDTIAGTIVDLLSDGALRVPVDRG